MESQDLKPQVSKRNSQVITRLLRWGVMVDICRGMPYTRLSLLFVFIQICLCVSVCACVIPGVGRSGLHTAGSSRWLELAQHTPTHRSLSKKSSFTSVYLLEDTQTRTRTRTSMHACMNAWLRACLKKPPTRFVDKHSPAFTRASADAVHSYIHTHKCVPSHTAPKSYVTVYLRHDCLSTLRLMMRSPCLLLWNKPWDITSVLLVRLSIVSAECRECWHAQSWPFFLFILFYMQKSFNQKPVSCHAPKLYI